MCQEAILCGLEPAAGNRHLNPLMNLVAIRPSALSFCLDGFRLLSAFKKVTLSNFVRFSASSGGFPHDVMPCQTDQRGILGTWRECSSKIEKTFTLRKVFVCVILCVYVYVHIFTFHFILVILKKFFFLNITHVYSYIQTPF